MAEGAAAPTGAPAAGGAAQAGNTGKGAPQAEALKTGAKSAPTSAPAEPPAWGDDDDAKFFELAKRSPYRARIKGEEKAIDSKESLRDLLNHAQRGIGAAKVVEGAKAETEAAKKERAEAAAERQLVARAKAGDFEARRALGLVPADEARQRDAEWEAVPKEVRALHDAHEQTKQELAVLRAEKEAAAAEVKQRQEATELAAAKRVAVNSTHEVMKALGVSEGNAERLLPHVAGAIADLSEHGLELGVDMTTDLILERVKQRLGKFDEDHFSGLAPERAVALLAPRLEKLDDAALEAALPLPLRQRIARNLARSITAQRARAQQGGGPAPVAREEERQAPSKVLQPFRFQR